jgi:glycerophosphoryl diester phosphodiesterase
MRALVLLTLLAGCIPLDSQGLPKKNPDFLVVGHRGAPYADVENTIPSYEAALALGANALEIDLCVTSDGVIVIWHDCDPDDSIAVARQNGLEGLPHIPIVPPDGSPYHVPVEQLTLVDFRANYGYAASGSSTKLPDVVVPTFAEFLTWLADQPDVKAVYLDIKVTDVDHAAAIVNAAAAANLRDVTFYGMSIYQPVVERLISEAADGVRVVFDHEQSGALARSEELGLRDLSLGLTALRTETEVINEIEEAVEARSKNQIDTITVWTLDSPMQMGVFLFHGVDAILTNDPQRLFDIWEATL